MQLEIPTRRGLDGGNEIQRWRSNGRVDCRRSRDSLLRDQIVAIRRVAAKVGKWNGVLARGVNVFVIALLNGGARSHIINIDRIILGGDNRNVLYSSAVGGGHRNTA